MNFEKFYALVRSSLKQYAAAGLINEMDVYDWVVSELNTFQMLPLIKIETILHVKNNSVKLPEGFKSLYSAVKCEPYKCIVEDVEPDILQDFYFYKVRELKNEDWNFCNPCDITETESCVVEKTYLHNNTRANFYYNNLTPLKLNLTPHVKRTTCDKECPNLSVHNSPYEISINRKTLYTNFKEGNIFLIYNGYEYDDDGFLIIPDTEENNLSKFLLASIKRKIIEELMANSDNNTNEQFLLSVYIAEEDLYRRRTMGELKMKRVLHGIKSYQSKIRRQFAVYDFGTYSHNHRGNRIEFLVV